MGSEMCIRDRFRAQVGINKYHKTEVETRTAMEWKKLWLLKQELTSESYPLKSRLTPANVRFTLFVSRAYGSTSLAKLLKCVSISANSCALTKSFDFWLRTVVEKMGFILSITIPKLTIIAESGCQRV